MKAAHPRRGRPVIALAMLLGGWVAARATLVEVMQPTAEVKGKAKVLLTARQHQPVTTARAPKLRGQRSGVSASFARPTPASTFVTSMAPAAIIQGTAIAGQLAPAAQAQTVLMQPASSAPPTAAGPVSVRVAAGHQLLWMAAVSQMPLPAGFASVQPAASPATPFYPARLRAASQARRWSADGWLMLRRGGGALASGPLPASYGASQMGAVLRYRLAPASGHRPTAYLRANAALMGAYDKEVAFGISARPLAGVPVIAAVFTGGTKLRPAAMVVTELPPANLPLGLRGEAYVQAGYVGGAGATAFADGQLKLDHRLAGMGKFELRAGAGAWGGTQKGAGRLDIGPSATLGVPMGAASARLALDWRFRVAGNAAPSSGPALTLSAGF